MEAFEPKDIYPCTVDERTWSKEVSMKELFGHLCYDGTFSHDQKMHEQLEIREGHPARKKIKREESLEDVQVSSQRSEEPMVSPYVSETRMRHAETAPGFVLTGSRALTNDPSTQGGLDLIPDPEGTLDMIRKTFEEARARSISG